MKRLVVARHLELLVVEVLDSLVVDQGVHGHSRGFVIGSISLSPELSPPGRRPNSKGSIRAHSDDGDGGKLSAILPGQDTTNHADLESGG